MYVLVANGYSGLVRDFNTLNKLSAIYPYPKYRKVKNETEGRILLERFRRGDYGSEFDNYGETDKQNGYAKVSYIIDSGNLYVNMDTSKVGFLRVKKPRLKDVFIDNKPDMVRIMVKDINLNDDLISDHCTAISLILRTIGVYCDLNLVIPDISIYLAITKYTGESYIIKELQEQISTRLGAISYTIGGIK